MIKPIYDSFMDSIDQLVKVIELHQHEINRPIVIGISGYCGGGKSSLAFALTQHLNKSISIRGDDFLNPEKSHFRSEDWDGVERSRLAEQVLIPFRDGKNSTYQPYDWSKRRLGDGVPLPDAKVLIVDGIGLFHPEITHLFDVRIWCEVDLETAALWGKTRDKRLGRHHEKLWDEVWIPNEKTFERNFHPRSQADYLLKPLPLNSFAGA